MKSFLFESVWLLSRQERKAVKTSFHSKKNLILGRNHTGKSTLIKNLFVALGAKPTGVLENWDVNGISLVAFRIDGKMYSAIHQQGNRALFDEKNQLMFASGTHAEWSEFFAKTVGLNLVLTDKNSKTVAADARCFFLPFYINQDGSWQSNWDTFVGLQQYKAPFSAILEYFSGIKPPEYYEVNSKKIQEQQLLDNSRKEQDFLQRARERFSKSTALAGPKLEVENFQQEISDLTTEVTELNRQQEILREAAVREQELLSSIGSQIHLAGHALATYHSDASYLREGSSDVLTCPTCGAEHTRSFIDLLGYAEDARILRELVAGLYEDERRVAEQNRQTQAKLRNLESHYSRVSQILSVRRGELVFKDVVNGIGAEQALAAFELENTVLQEEISRYTQVLGELHRQLDALTSKERTQDILKTFREAYSACLSDLNLPPRNLNKVKLNNRPDVSGSGGPRTILAYYAALWRTCFGAYGSFRIPLVIDSPNQQGQDDINLPAVLKFIAGNLPLDTQIIVGSEIRTAEEFDNTIFFDRQWSLLQEDDYSSGEQVIDPLISAMYNAIGHTKESI